MYSINKRDTPGIIIQALLCALYATDNPGSSGKDIAKALNLSHSTVVRTWALLRQLGVDIRYQNKKKGFVVLDWGVFNKKKVKILVGHGQRAERIRTRIEVK
jgi:biotin operon repressor